MTVTELLTATFFFREPRRGALDPVLSVVVGIEETKRYAAICPLLIVVRDRSVVGSDTASCA